MARRLRRLHKASMYAVVAAAFVSLAGGGDLSLLTTVGYGAGVAGAWFVDAWAELDERHNLWWNALIVAVLAASVLQLALTDAAYFDVGVRFVLFMTVVRLMSCHRARDELQVYALTILQVGAGTVAHDELTFGLAFAAYVCTATFSLALFHLRHELEDHAVDLGPGDQPFDRRYMTVLGGIAGGIFATSLVIFFAFPRIGFGFFETQSRGNQHVSGFSESVELGSHGAIRENPRVVMRIAFPEGRPDNLRQLHWRTMTFDEYTGNGWRRNYGEHSEAIWSSEGSYHVGSRFLDALPTDEPVAIPERMRFYVEPLDTAYLPTLWPTRSIEFGRSSDRAPPGSPRAGRLRLDYYGDVAHSVPSEVGIPYTIETTRRPSPERLREADGSIPTAALEPFLQLPREMSRVRELAERLTQPDQTPYEKASAIEDHLEANFTYTTNLPDVDAERPIESFLFDTQRGHCEYYATSMALMLRTLDIPARIVNGFLGGRWNSVGNYLAVRQGDAHAWVELYLPSYGWVPIDPTPAASVQAASPGGAGWFGETYDAMRMFWIRWVVEYDLKSQIEAVRAARRWLERPDDNRREQEGASAEKTGGLDWRTLVLWAGLAALFLGGLFSAHRHDARFEWVPLLVHAVVWSGASALWLSLYWGFRTEAFLGGLVAGLGSVAVGASSSFFGDPTGAPAPTRLFHRIERAAERGELARRPGEPAAAFLGRIADAHPDLREHIHRFRRRYLAARFGGRTFDPDTRREMEQTVQRIEEEFD